MQPEPQLEFANLPPRRINIPVETTTELERIMRQILMPLKPEERVTICVDLINFTGEICLTSNPLRLVDRQPKAYKQPSGYRGPKRHSQGNAAGLANASRSHMDHGCRRFRFFHIIVAVIVALMICGIKAGPGLFRHWHFPTAISSTGHSGNKARSEVHFSPSGACTEACVVIRDLTYMRNWAEDREYERAVSRPAARGNAAKS